MLAAAHITGGGLLENLPRVLPKHLKCRLSAKKWEFPALFRWLMAEGKISWKEMARTFNCGLGMVLVVKKESVDDVLGIMEQAGERAWVVGQLENRESNDEEVVIDDCLLTWK